MIQAAAAASVFVLERRIGCLRSFTMLLSTDKVEEIGSPEDRRFPAFGVCAEILLALLGAPYDWGEDPRRVHVLQDTQF